MSLTGNETESITAIGKANEQQKDSMNFMLINEQLFAANSICALTEQTSEVIYTGS